MTTRFIAISTAVALVLGTTSAIADHNSKNEEGWANMPNDIHNTRVETLEADDNEAFQEFVKYGEGSDSVNRFDSDDTTAKRAKAPQGEAKAVKSQQKKMTGNRENNQVQDKRKNRPDPGAASMSRERAGMRSDRALRSERQMNVREHRSERRRRD